MVMSYSPMPSTNSKYALHGEVMRGKDCITNLLKILMRLTSPVSALTIACSHSSSALEIGAGLCPSCCFPFGIDCPLGCENGHAGPIPSTFEVKNSSLVKHLFS